MCERVVRTASIPGWREIKLGREEGQAPSPVIWKYYLAWKNKWLQVCFARQLFVTYIIKCDLEL
jgi:hypothetical protein